MFPSSVRVAFARYRLIFKFPAGTSRGVLREKLTFFLRVDDASDPANRTYGEVPFFEGLSAESLREVEKALHTLIKIESFEDLQRPTGISSLDFGLEQVVRSFQSSSPGILFHSPFSEGRKSISINGLIWMGEYDTMKKRLEEKIRDGFECIKIKIGAISWDDELRLLRFVRDKMGSEVSIRVDANGAFSAANVMRRLEDLAPFGIHSIEQPVRHGNAELMRKVCADSPVPVALDEELIGIPISDDRSGLLEFIRPHYIVLKPSLCFGFGGASDWMDRADKLGIGHWITSALESSVGLNALAQFTGTLNPQMSQGLGTGALYTNNFPSPLRLEGSRLNFVGPAEVYYPALDGLNWIRQ